MLNFKKIQPEILRELKPFFAGQTLRISDYSLGFQFMWNGHLDLEYAIAAGCLILREKYAGQRYYHYPVSPEGEEREREAISLIEDDCRDTSEKLIFTNVPKCKLVSLIDRGGQEWNLTNERRWRDYLYRAEDFKTYAGGKYAGQRNHVNKFKKSNPEWAFEVYKADDEARVRAFLKEYESVQRSKKSFLADAEMTAVFDLLPHIGEYGMSAGFLTVEGKIAAFSAGERCGDTIIVHVEKALREYEGIYPVLAQEFARAFCRDGEFLNRMDDAGDRGLRKSKLQYLPCEILDKFIVAPVRAIDRVARIPVLKTERLKLAPVKNRDAETYRALALDRERNKFWGYDWADDYKEGEPSAEWFLALARKDFKEKHEMSFGIYCGEALVGEAVLHRFGYRGEAEIGARVLFGAEGRGYASEAVRRLADYAFYELGVERVEAKRFHENERSGRMLLGAGLKECGADETYTYYIKTPSM